MSSARPTAFAIVAFLVAFPIAAAESLAPVNVILNGEFEAYAPLVATTLASTGLSTEQGVGRQVLGCSTTANLLWGKTCDGAPTSTEDALVELASNPDDEFSYWLEDGRQEGDVVYVAPAQASLLSALNWHSFPSGSVSFRDVEANLDREAIIGPDNYMLYQTWSSTSAHEIVPLGRLSPLSVRIETGAPGGTVAFALDAFPFETVSDIPQVSVNYQLAVPAEAWTQVGGVWIIDPVRGSLAGPYSGTYLPSPDEALAAPSPEWATATAEERRSILLRFRAVQLAFWELPAGVVLDDVRMEIAAQG